MTRPKNKVLIPTSSLDTINYACKHGLACQIFSAVPEHVGCLILHITLIIYTPRAACCQAFRREFVTSSQSSWCMTGGKANLVCFDVNLLLNLLSMLTSLSCLASTWWDHLNHDYRKKSLSSASLPAVWTEEQPCSISWRCSILASAVTTSRCTGYWT